MRNQPWGNKFTSLQIIIAPPIWLTWYAKLLYAILIILILFGVLRFYKRKLALESRLNLEHHQHENDQKLNNERLRFYTNITHELRTPLTLILGPLEDLLADKTLSPRQANKISIKGSKFTLKLITENTYPNAEHQIIKEVHKSEENDEQTISIETEDGKPIILIVEDNRDIREYVRSSFEEMYEVLTAADRKEGWDIAQNQIPNIIISDIMMPVMDGIELCRHIKEDMRTSHIPVILLTAKDTLQDKEEGYAAGADSFITKPFSARLLNSRINNILENRRKTAGVITSIPETESEQENIENERKNLNKLDQEFLDKVTAIIEENLCMEKMDVAFIADKMCMSHSTLYRKIKGLTEMTVNEYVRKIKMKKGMELINEGKYSLAEISDLTGFSSVAYFRQCFKDEYGMAPTEYLKRKQN